MCRPEIASVAGSMASSGWLCQWMPRKRQILRRIMSQTGSGGEFAAMVNLSLGGKVREQEASKPCEVTLLCAFHEAASSLLLTERPCWRLRLHE